MSCPSLEKRKPWRQKLNHGAGRFTRLSIATNANGGHNRLRQNLAIAHDTLARDEANARGGRKRGAHDQSVINPRRLLKIDVHMGDGEGGGVLRLQTLVIHPR